MVMGLPDKKPPVNHHSPAVGHGMRCNETVRKKIIANSHTVGHGMIYDEILLIPAACHSQSVQVGCGMRCIETAW